MSSVDWRRRKGGIRKDKSRDEGEEFKGGRKGGKEEGRKGQKRHPHEAHNATTHTVTAVDHCCAYTHKGTLVSSPQLL